MSAETNRSEEGRGDLHGDSPVFHAGARLEAASGAVVLLHGRGASARDILGLGGALAGASVALIAPEAAGHTWYPNSFLAPREANEPWLSSALRKIEGVVDGLVAGGLSPERIVVCGFSQGACLATEFVCSHPARYGGLVALTGGLVGPLGSDLQHNGQLDGMPAFLGSGDPDPHVPWRRVMESAEVLRGMGAGVETRRYPGRAHTVSAEEIEVARELIARAFANT